MNDIQPRLKNIKALLLDCDGVLTDGTIWLSDSGEWRRNFSILDGMGIRNLLLKGYEVGVITGSKGSDIAERCKALEIPHLYLGSLEKGPAFEDFLAKTKLAPENVAYVGDDHIDLPILKQAGFSVTVPGAMEAVLSSVHYITKRPGGFGAVREVCDLILNA